MRRAHFMSFLAIPGKTLNDLVALHQTDALNMCHSLNELEWHGSRAPHVDSPLTPGTSTCHSFYNIVKYIEWLKQMKLCKFSFLKTKFYKSLICYTFHSAAVRGGCWDAANLHAAVPPMYAPLPVTVDFLGTNFLRTKQLSANF
jgi:hypothetical protein